MNFKVSAKKADGKWWSFGSIKTNQYGNQQLSFKNTPEFREHLAKAGDWINFSLFEDKPKDDAHPKTISNNENFDDSIPF